MPKDYKPPRDAADTFARYKAHYEGERALKPEMLQFADRELKAGATVGQLATWTGLTPEVFRRRARALGVERKRPPTVGKVAGTEPQTDASPGAAAPRRQVTQALPKPVPSISTKVRQLPVDRVSWLANRAEEMGLEWVAELRRDYPHLKGPDWDYVVVETGLQKGLKIPELAETPDADPVERPVGSEETTP